MWFRAGLFIGLIALIVGIYAWGYRSGLSSLDAALQSDRVKIIQDGKEIDRGVEILDDTGLCAILGGCELRDDTVND